MQHIISASIAGIIAGAVLNISAVTKEIPIVRDTLEHRALSLFAWFILFTILGYIVINKYITAPYSYSGFSRVLHFGAVSFSSLLLLVAFGVQILGLNTLVTLPNSLLAFATAWYAIPVALIVHYAVLFIIRKY